MVILYSPKEKAKTFLYVNNDVFSIGKKKNHYDNK